MPLLREKGSEIITLSVNWRRKYRKVVFKSVQGKIGHT